ncbi:MAG: hypothetical protein F9K44_05535 [Hyphomicrobiaceae bacterium]|nr:MAG: hypothetical protein F9K44_05535 [Hyphomicrobiaceae bacterium]
MKPLAGIAGRYLLASAILHLIWEVLQLPFYTIWQEPWRSQAFAILHCTSGDILIAAISFAAACLVLQSQWRLRWLLIIALGVGYTVFSEWLNVAVRGTWTYSKLMPVLPPLGTGLTPLLQWFLVPTLALAYALGQLPTQRGQAS